MKAQVNPVVVGVIIAVLLVVVGFGIWKAGEPAREAGNKPPGMPADAAAEMQRRMGGSSGTTAPGVGSSSTGATVK